MTGIDGNNLNNSDEVEIPLYLTVSAIALAISMAFTLDFLDMVFNNVNTYSTSYRRISCSICLYLYDYMVYDMINNGPKYRNMIAKSQQSNLTKI